ncbi:hypothetical protein SGRIM128S_03628 [Streptomyces griseomycini]
MNLFAPEQSLGEEGVHGRAGKQCQALRYVVGLGDHVSFSLFVRSRLRIM